LARPQSHLQLDDRSVLWLTPPPPGSGAVAGSSVALVLSLSLSLSVALYSRELPSSTVSFHMPARRRNPSSSLLSPPAPYIIASWLFAVACPDTC